MGRQYAPRGGRAVTLIGDYARFLRGTIGDIGAGSNAAPLAREFGSRYCALDIGDSYKLETSTEREAIRHVANIEGQALPFADRQFDTVLCMDVLEHVDDPHALLGELFRVSAHHVIVSLPNNWPGFIWSLLAGRNITHHAGYGIGGQPKSPGQRHKHFFNLEEAASFLLDDRTVDFVPVDVTCRFEHGSDGLLSCAPRVNRVMSVAGRVTPDDARARFGSAGVLLWVAAKIGYYVLRVPDTLLTALFYGWGAPVRFYNLFCRQLWVVYERRSGQ